MYPRSRIYQLQQGTLKTKNKAHSNLLILCLRCDECQLLQWMKGPKQNHSIEIRTKNSKRKKKNTKIGFSQNSLALGEWLQILYRKDREREIEREREIDRQRERMKIIKEISTQGLAYSILFIGS